MFFPQEPRLQGGGRTLTPPPPQHTAIGCILLTGWPATSAPHCSTRGRGVLLRHPPAGAAEHPSSGICKRGASILPAQGAAGPPRPGCAWVGCCASPPPPTLASLCPIAPSAGAAKLALCSWVPLCSRWWVPARWGRHAGGSCLHPCTPLPTRPRRRQRQRERETLKSIYWCWPRSELLGLPQPWPRHRLWGAWWGMPATKSPRGASPAPPNHGPPAPVCKGGAARGGGPGVSTI